MRRSRYVDFFSEQQDHACALLAALGMSDAAIIKQTNLSHGQIHYRLAKAQVKRMDYRNGTSTFAKLTFKTVKQVAEDELVRHLKRHMAA